MAKNKKSKFLKRAVATTIATVMLPGAGGLATTISTNDVEKNITINGEETVNLDTNTRESSFKLKSNKQEVPYFYYWTNQNSVYLSWDYGHIANRPDKIEVVIDDNLEFKNPSYVRVKPKGAEFESNIDGDFYLRVRFYDSSGNVSHESIRKVVKNSTETREIKGLTYKSSGTGIKIEWANFVDGIKSGEVFVDGKQYKTLSSDDIKNNSVNILDVTEGSEIKIKILNGMDLEYNGVVIVKQGTLKPVADLELGLSGDGVGINVNFSRTNFKKGNRFSVSVKDLEDGEVIVQNSQIILEEDKGTFNVYPDAGKTFINSDYELTIKDVDSGEVYSYKYTHSLYTLPEFTSISLHGGNIISSWSKVEGVAHTDLTWNVDGSNDYKSEKVDLSKNGVTFKSGISKGKVNLILTNYDDKGRILSQNFDTVIVTDGLESGLTSFKGIFKGENSAEFAYDKFGTKVVSGILQLNDQMIALSTDQLNSANLTNSFIVNGVDKNQKYTAKLYLLTEDGNVLTSESSEILSEDDANKLSNVIIKGDSGISGKYTIDTGILTLTLNSNMYNVDKNSTVNLTVGGNKISSISASYDSTTNSINIKGFIPTKEYSDIVISYKDNSGESKSINLKTLLITKGSVLDSFLVGAYNNSISRKTQLIDEDGYNYWKIGLLDRKFGLSYFIRNLAYVPEFMSLINSPQDLVTRLYNVLVLRNPDPQGMQFWTYLYNELIKNGVSHTEAVLKILVDMTSSSEFANLAARLKVNP